MANRSTTAPGAVGATVPALGGAVREERTRTVSIGALGVTQRPADVGDGVALPHQGTEVVESKGDQAESLKVQQQQVGLLQQNKALLERALNNRAPPPAPGPLPQVGQTARDAATSLLFGGSGYLAVKGIAQASATIGRNSKKAGSTGSEGHPDGAQVSTTDRAGTVYLPPLVIGGSTSAPGIDDYLPGADAMPAPIPRPSGPGHWAQALMVGKSAAVMAGADAAMKSIFTATTASTPEQIGEGVGGAAGGFMGAVSGAMLGGRLKVGAPAASMALSFIGDKVGGTLGKELMAAPDGASQRTPATNALPGQSTPPAGGTSPSPATTLSGTLASAAGIGAVAAAYTHRERLLGLGRARGVTVLDDIYPLGADAGPSPTAINAPSGRWATLKNGFKAAGKMPWVEAGIKGAYTYATAKTPEEKGAGYGGAIGGAVGTALGGTLLGSIVTPPFGMLIGNMVGDKIGGVIGGWVGKTFLSASDESHGKPRSAITLRDPRQVTLTSGREVFDEQVGTRMARQLLSAKPPTLPKPGSSADAHPAGGVVIPMAFGADKQAATTVGKYFAERAAEFRPVAQANRPIGMQVLPKPHEASALGAGAPETAKAGKSLPERVTESGPAAPVSVPPAPMALPDAGPRPTQGLGATTQPITQQFTFTANMPITVHGSVDAPNQLTVQLEETVRRVMQDLQRQAYNAQLADHPNSF